MSTMVDVTFVNREMESYSLDDYEVRSLLTHFRNFRKDSCVFHEIDLGTQTLLINLTNVVRVYIEKQPDDKNIKDHLELLNE